MKNRKALAVALALVGLPVVIVPIEAVSFYSANRDNGSFVSSGEKREYLLYVRGAMTPRSRPLSSSACTARGCGARLKGT